MTDSDETEGETDSSWSGPTISRRKVVGAVSALVGLGLAGSAQSQSTLSTKTLVTGGSNVSITSATKVAGTELFIGPDSTKSNVSQQAGRVFRAVDTNVEYYSDGNQWVKFSVGSSQESVPAVIGEDIQANNKMNLGERTSPPPTTNVGDFWYRGDKD
jgi:hypothetical protein